MYRKVKVDLILSLIQTVSLNECDDNEMTFKILAEMLDYKLEEEEIEDWLGYNKTDDIFLGDAQAKSNLFAEHRFNRENPIYNFKSNYINDLSYLDMPQPQLPKQDGHLDDTPIDDTPF